MTPGPHIGAGEPDSQLTEAGIAHARAEVARVDELLPKYQRVARDLVPILTAKRRRLVAWLEKNDPEAKTDGR